MNFLGGFLLLAVVKLSAGQDQESAVVQISETANVTITPAKLLRLTLKKTATLSILYQTTVAEDFSQLVINCSVDPLVADVQQSVHNITNRTGHHSVEFICSFKGLYLAREKLFATIQRTNETNSEVLWSLWVNSTSDNITDYEILIVYPYGVTNVVIQILLLLTLAANAFVYGVKLELEKVKVFIKQPCALGISFLCQYIIMPSLAFVFSQIVDLKAYQAFGLLAMCCVPSGMPSNLVTVVLRGEVSLSVIMTAFSLIASTGMTPAWMYTVGQLMINKGYDDVKIFIPWKMIGLIVLLLTAPIFIGAYFRSKKPDLSAIVAKRLRMATSFLFSAMIIVIIIIYVWLIDYIKEWRVVIPSVFLPYISCLLSFLMSHVACQPWKTSLTIMIETGVQNVTFVLLYIGANIPEPDDGKALCMVAVTVFSIYIPLIGGAIGYAIYDFIEVRPVRQEIKLQNSISFVNSIRLSETSTSMVEIGSVATPSVELDTPSLFRSDSKTTFIVGR